MPNWPTGGWFDASYESVKSFALGEPIVLLDVERTSRAFRPNVNGSGEAAVGSVSTRPFRVVIWIDF